MFCPKFFWIHKFFRTIRENLKFFLKVFPSCHFFLGMTFPNFSKFSRLIFSTFPDHFCAKLNVLGFEYKYIWRNRNTSFSKMRGKYDRVRCSDNFNHKKVIIRGFVRNTLKIMWRFLRENFDNFRRKILTIFLWKVDYFLQKNFTIFAEKFNDFWKKI